MLETQSTQPIFDFKNMWDKVLSDIELSVSKANFNTWFKDTFITRFGDGVVTIGVPNTFVKEWLSTRYHGVILKSLRELNEHVRALEYLVTKNDLKTKAEISMASNIFTNNNTELPLSDLYINKEDNLNPRYTFESFVVGPFNEVAHAASQAILKRFCAYNPLFIYGNTGYGKTHLIQAVGNHIKQTTPTKKVYYISSEKFSIDYVNAVQQNRVNLFKEKYRKYDLFIMDDIQFLTKKDKTQEELFHLFNTLYDNNKQIIFSSDKHPNQIPEIEDRLRSRFAQGMMVDIQPPDRESRMAIIKNKISSHNLVLSEDVIDFLSSFVDGNIREIEGAINNIICQTHLRNKPITIGNVRQIIKNIEKPKKNISVKDVVKIISEFYNIDESSIYEKTRKMEIVKPRQVIMFILREDLGISYPSIGEKLGGRDHTTVIHSCEKIKNEMKENSSLFREVEQIRGLLH